MAFQMQISSRGLNLIKEFEGLHSTAYVCPGGVNTIGYGHVIKAGEQFSHPLSKTQAEALLCQDIKGATHAIGRLIKVPLTQGQFDALVSFTFNCGAGALQRSTLRACVNRQEHFSVPGELLKWCHSSGKRIPGLLKRRMAETLLYLT